MGFLPHRYSVSALIFWDSHKSRAITVEPDRAIACINALASASVPELAVRDAVDALGAAAAAFERISLALGPIDPRGSRLLALASQVRAARTALCFGQKTRSP